MNKCSRRNIFKLAGAGSLALLLPAVALKNTGSAWAQAPDNALDPESPQAKALGYHEHYSDVDQSVWARYKEGQICGNCQLAQGDVSADWMGCGIFPGKQVAREGWCNAWVARQG